MPDHRPPPAPADRSPRFPTPADVRVAADELYGGLGGVGRYKQVYRPQICPFHLLVDEVPAGARVLDIGCGSGLFLGLLAAGGWIGPSLGFDSSPGAIAMAQGMAGRIRGGGNVRFEQRDVQDDWPEGSFDVVSLIDVVHHVPPGQQAAVLREAASRIAPGGLFLYKDMVERPWPRAWANRLHDLLLARQWIHYLPLADAKSELAGCGLHFVREGAANMLWYGHEWVVFQRPRG